ncbi:hypothetical protein [Roseobacter sp. GAI101]|uniref:hypothetical protein n=1 Tax=Roseobacter sp. (strain GAI101) TaxID=391589 RepID=UPI00055EEB4E|nr:hypothetical protein [Roseobacter sp. GAI101]
MSVQNKNIGWLLGSTAVGKAILRADMVIDGEITAHDPAKPWIAPPNPTGKFFSGGFEKYLKDLESPTKTKDKLNPTKQALYQLVINEIDEFPIEAEGRTWADLPAEKIAASLAISPDHARRLYRGSPFRHVIKMRKGKKTTLIRIGLASDLTHEDQARMMAKFWRNATGRNVDKKQFGLLVGIAKECPPALAFDIFRTIVSNWSPFMACVKVAQFIGQHDGDAYDQNKENFYTRFLRFPSISLFRRFTYVALDYYSMAVQGQLSETKCPDLCHRILKELNNINKLSSL